MDNQKILDKLKELKILLIPLKLKHHSQGKDDFYRIMILLDRIVDRTYPEKDAKSIKNKYHRIAFFGGEIPDEEKQKDFIKDIEGKIKAIDLILEEYSLFGFDDFKQVKEKIETEIQIGSNKIGFWRKKKSK